MTEWSTIGVLMNADISKAKYSESRKSRLFRLKMNFFPAYRGTGARVIHISDNLLEVIIKLPFNWTTNNYVGSIFGGSIYASVDPVYMIMLIRLLGKDYIVWDKSATIKFIKPGKETLYARFELDKNSVEKYRAELEEKHSIDKVFSVELVNKAGLVHALIEKTIYMRKKENKNV